MRPHPLLAILFTCLVALAILSGCSGTKMTTSSTTTTSPSPTPPTTSPTPSPSPTPTPPTTTPPPTTPPTPSVTPQYEAALLRPVNTGTGESAGGQIIVNAGGTSGAGKVTATNGAKSATYTITFRPFTNSSNSSSIQVGTVMSDASGTINGSFTFPQKGTFAGIFHLSAGTNASNTEIDPMDSGVDDNTTFVFNVPLVQASQVSPVIQNVGTPGFPTTFGTDPLASGFVTANQGKLHVEFHGAAPNATYDIVQCDPVNGCNAGGTVTTDGPGTAISDQTYFVTNRWDPRVVFGFLKGFNNLEYVTGFTVK